MTLYSRIQHHQLMLMAGTAIIGISLCFSMLSAYREMGDFQLTHYYFNYSEEHVRRGLVGEILRIVNFPISNITVSLLFNAATLIILLFLFAYSVFIFKRTSSNAGVIFVAFMLACPGISLHFSFSSYGYLDVFQILTLISGVVLISRLSLYPAVAAAMLCSTIAILIHETGLIVTAPVLIASLALRFPDRFRFPEVAVIGGLLLAFSLLNWHFGGANATSFNEHIKLLQESAGADGINPAAVVVLHRSLADNVGLVLPRSPYWYAWQQIKFFVFAFPHLFFAAITLVHMRGVLKESGRAFAGNLVILAVVAPIFLYPIGHDYFRWWSLALVNFFLSIFIIYSVHPKIVDVLERDVLRYKNLMITGTLIGLTFGGVGGLVSFSLHTSPAAMAIRALF